MPHSNPIPYSTPMPRPLPISVHGALPVDLKHNAANTNLDSMNEGTHLHIGDAIAIPRDVNGEAIAIPSDSINKPGRIHNYIHAYIHMYGTCGCPWTTKEAADPGG